MQNAREHQRGVKGAVSILFSILHRSEWVGKTALPRAENRDMDPAMPSLRPSPVPQCLLHGEKQTLCPSTGPKGGVFKEELTSRLQTPHCPLLLLTPSPVGHHPSCGPSSLPPPDTKRLFSAPPGWGDSPMVPSPDTQVVTQRHTLLPRARAAAGNPNPQAPEWSPSPGSSQGDDGLDTTEIREVAESDPQARAHYGKQPAQHR